MLVSAKFQGIPWRFPPTSGPPIYLPSFTLKRSLQCYFSRTIEFSPIEWRNTRYKNIRLFLGKRKKYFNIHFRSERRKEVATCQQVGYKIFFTNDCQKIICYFICLFWFFRKMTE